MKYRTKLFLLFVLVWLILSVVGRVWFYYEVKSTFLNQQRSKVRLLAAAIAQTFPGDPLKSQLIRIRDANQRSDIDLRNIYFIRQIPGDPTQVELSDGGKTPAGSPASFLQKNVWPEARTNGILQHIKENWATEDFYTDETGTWLTGIAPLYDIDHRYVGTLAVDLSSRSILAESHKLQLLALIGGAAVFLAGFLVASILAHIATKSLTRITEGVEEIGRGNLKTKIDVQTPDEFGKLAQTIHHMEKSIEENSRLRLNFVRYVSSHVMEKILASDVSEIFKGERRKITVLFSDIRQFSTLSEKMDPEEVVSLLNEYLERMIQIIFENHGTLDKFIGDGIMVEFGAPLDDENQEKHALKTAIEMYLALSELNVKWERERKIHLDMGIGIHTGLAVVGDIGSEKRMEYTAIGDTVNVAARLQRASREQMTSILFSETTAVALGAQYKIRSLGLLKLQGRESPIEAFTVDWGEK